MDRLHKVEALLEVSEYDAIYISDLINIRYLIGFTGSYGYLYVSKTKKIFITDGRYEEQAYKEVDSCEILTCKGKDVTCLLRPIIESDNIKGLGIENSVLTVDEYDWMKCQLPAVHLLYLDNSITSFREVKDKEEIRKLRSAALLTDRAFSHVINYMAVGMNEKEIALELEVFLRKNGASDTSFSTIVASGSRSSLPHGRASDKLIEVGDLVTIDFGCILDGYCSDMTRTLVMGKASSRQVEIYNLVKKSQQLAIDCLQQGVIGADIDRIARAYIDSKGYGDYFNHSLGHSLGLSVHEYPRLSTTTYCELKAGMVLTVEPGVYVPDFGGVRIEDMVHVTEKACEVLTKSPKELIEVGI